MIKEEDSGGEVPSTSVANIASYPQMLKKALKRNNTLCVNQITFDKIKNMKEQDILKEFNLKTPCLISCDKKHILVSKYK
jgi:hypothetical protein